MTELIVALDLRYALETSSMMQRLRQAGVTWFKVGPRLLLSPGGADVCLEIAERWNLMLDLKLYDTRDTVAATARRAFEMGARFLTIHATPSMLEAAMAAKTDDRQKVLAVGALTDGGPAYAFAGTADGVTLPVDLCRVVARPLHELGKIVVCPGIRRATIFDSGDAMHGDFSSRWVDKPDNHVNPATPAEARAAGADYVVVGRPIINSPDQVAAARAIMKELR